MAKVFAIFADEAALEQVTQTLQADDYEVMAPETHPTERKQDETVVVAAPVGSSPVGIMVPVAETVMVSGHTLEQEVQDKGLPEEEARMFADALRSGSHVLIVRHANDATADQLRQAGADHVSPN